LQARRSASVYHSVGRRRVCKSGGVRHTAGRRRVARQARRIPLRSPRGNARALSRRSPLRARRSDRVRAPIRHRHSLAVARRPGRGGGRPRRHRVATSGAVSGGMTIRIRNGHPTNDNANRAAPRRPTPAVSRRRPRGHGRSCPYLEDLGVTAVWLTPPNLQNGPVAGVRRLSRLLESTHGSARRRAATRARHAGARHAQLADDMHARNMKLVLDIVVNHAGDCARLAIRNVRSTSAKAHMYCSPKPQNPN
jgi:hypothetical protein